MRVLARALAAAAVAAGLVAGPLAAGAAPAERPSAAEIVRRSVAARGGLDAWQKVTTMEWRGHVVSARAPAGSVAFRLAQKRENKTRLEIDNAGERSVRVFDGARGWKVHFGHGKPQAQPYTPQELLYARAGHGIGGPLVEAAARGLEVTLEGVDDVAGRQAYHLLVHLSGGGTEHVWVDAQTFLEVRYDRTADAPSGGQHRVSMSFEDYRPVDGLMLPFVIETGGGPGAAADRMQIEAVLLNTPLEDSSFENPAGPRPHHRTRPAATHKQVITSEPPAVAGAPGSDQP